MGKQKWGSEGAGINEKIVTCPGDVFTGAKPCQPFAFWLGLWENSRRSVPRICENVEYGWLCCIMIANFY